MQAHSLRSNFFTSLKQVEKRLKLESPSESSDLPALLQHQGSNSSSTESPIYLNLDQTSKSSALEDSELPREFLSSSPEFPSTHESFSQQNGVDFSQKIEDEAENNVADDIKQLIQLLGLLDCGGEVHLTNDEGKVGFSSRCQYRYDGQCCVCNDKFYSEVVRVKGPKCAKEVSRLEGWIKHLSPGGGCGEGEEDNIERLRLAHLLLGKAVFYEGGTGCFEGLEFPLTVHEYLLVEPPTD